MKRKLVDWMLIFVARKLMQIKKAISKLEVKIHLRLKEHNIYYNI
jgi:hypothetical protein